jgi:hypothetical protein
MKSCSKCGKSFDRQRTKCPHCGEPNGKSSGLFQTSAVLISSGGADLVYRSVDEVPVALRNKLLKSTIGQNSATILIADRRGRAEVAKAVRALPGTTQKRLLHALLGDPTGRARTWLLSARHRALLALSVLLAAAAMVLGFMRHWR